MEHEMAFDTNCLGFPSIQGCHAIVYQTNAGIYGFHVAGGSAAEDWPLNGQVFSDFVLAHGGGLIPAGSRLYGVTFVDVQRGYFPEPKKPKWKGELVEFASKLGYTGKISGYDLDKRLPTVQGGAAPSAYVEYRVNAAKCDVYVKKWDGPHQPNRTANIERTNHKSKHKRYGEAPKIIELDRIVVGNDFNTNDVAKVSKEKLR